MLFRSSNELYPTYKSTSQLLAQLEIDEDFISDNNTVRFGHRKTNDKDIYFVANRTNDFQKTSCTFRAVGEPELLMSTSGVTRKITNYSIENGLTTIPMEFLPYESFFVTFSGKNRRAPNNQDDSNFPVFTDLSTIEGAWNVSFNPKYGGPEHIIFDELDDWTSHAVRGVKYYSGIATYKKTIEIEKFADKQIGRAHV